MAIVMKVDGTTETLTPAGAKGELTLQQMQDAVGGYIEAVPGTQHRVWCNEEGRLQQLPINEGASALFGQILVGNVLVIDDDMVRKLSADDGD